MRQTFQKVPQEDVQRHESKGWLLKTTSEWYERFVLTYTGQSIQPRQRFQGLPPHPENETFVLPPNRG